MSKQPGKLKVVSNENVRLPIMLPPMQLKPKDVVILCHSVMPLQQIVPTQFEVLAVDSAQQKVQLTNLRWYNEDEVMLFTNWAAENFDD